MTTPPTSPALTARHTPNPCDQHSAEGVTTDPFPFMWYYRTEVTNHSDRPLRIVEFECFVRRGGRWVAGNLRGRSLVGTDFAEWYSGAQPDGTIAPGATAVCRRNWHGRPRPWSSRVKWVYVAVDDAGTHHSADAVVTPSPIRSERAVEWSRRQGASVVVRGAIVAALFALVWATIAGLAGAPLLTHQVLTVAFLGFATVVGHHLLHHTERGNDLLELTRRWDPARR